MKTRAVILVSVALTSLALTACAPTETQVDAQPSTPAASSEPAPTEVNTSPTAAPAPGAEAEIDKRDARYQAAVAAYPDAPPAGYAWPANVTDLPGGGSQALAAQRVDNIYRCMLIDAAWVAYFEDNDAERSIDLATRADALYDGSTDTVAVTYDGRISDSQLAAANGICRGHLGDLKG